MSDRIHQYTDIIHIQSRMLMDSNQTYMSLAQRQAIELINRYASQLATTSRQALLKNADHASVRHEMINILTPIVGYIEMLSDGWIGVLSPDQSSHVEIIHQSVRALNGLVLSYGVKNSFSDSA